MTPAAFGRYGSSMSSGIATGRDAGPSNELRVLATLRSYGQGVRMPGRRLPHRDAAPCKLPDPPDSVRSRATRSLKFE